MGDKLSRFTTTTKKKSNTPTNNLAVIILGSRVEYGMKSWGPKPLIKLPNGKRIIDKMIEDIKVCYPRSEILLTCGFESEKVIRGVDGVRIIENQIYNDTNEAEDLRLAMNNTVCNRALILSINYVFNREMIKKICNFQSCTVVEDSDMLNKGSVGATIVDNKISILSYGLPNSPKWCNVTYVENNEFTVLKKVANIKDNSKMFVFELINQAIDRKCVFASQTSKAAIMKISNSADVGKVSKDVL